MAGLDPYEERLLIALLGGGVALIFALVLGIICCRKYRLDRSGGGKQRKWNQQQIMFQQPGRPTYYPTGHQTNVNMDPAFLDPARAYHLPPIGPNLNPTYASAGPAHQQQQPAGARRPATGNVDNTAYASVPPLSPQGRQPSAMSYSNQV